MIAYHRLPVNMLRSIGWVLGGVLVALLPTTVWADEGDETIVVFEPRRKTVLSSTVSTRIVRLTREAGETIQEGEPLVELDDRLHQIAVHAAEASLDSASSDLEAARALGEVDLDEANIARVQVPGALLVTLLGAAGISRLSALSPRPELVAIGLSAVVLARRPCSDCLTQSKDP